jgi:tetratricopeptide (TPR) repeat protein
MPDLHLNALHYRQAVDALNSGDYPAAVVGLTALVGDDPLHHEAFQHLAIAHLCLGNGDAALDAATRALILLPESLEYLLVRAEAYRLVKDYDRARRDLEHALTIDPKFFAAYNNLAIVEKAVGHYETAEARLNQALALKPDYIDALYNMARLQAQIGAFEKAAIYLAQARRLNPNDARFAVAPQALVTPLDASASAHALPAKTDPAAPDRALIATLAEALASGALTLDLDVKKLSHPDSPIGRQTDTNQVLAATVALILALLWLAPFVVSAPLALGIMIAYTMLMPRYLAKKLRHRIASDALAAIDLWEKLWRYGGLRMLTPNAGPQAAAPGDDWRAFVRLLEVK